MSVELSVAIRLSKAIVQLFDCASSQPQRDNRKPDAMTQIQTDRGSDACPFLLLFDFMQTTTPSQVLLLAGGGSMFLIKVISKQPPFLLDIHQP